MGRMIIGLALLFLLLSVLEVSCSAVPKAVETIVFDDFESYYTGTFPYSGGWELWFSGAGYRFQRIVDNVSASPTNSLQLLGVSGWAAFAAKRFSTGSSKIGFEVSVRVEEVTGGGGDNARVSFTKLQSPSISREYAPILFLDDGEIICGSKYLQSYVADTWYRVKLILDRSANTCSIWIDGQPKAENLPLFTKSPPETTRLGYEIEAFSVSQCYNTIRAYFDDVKLFGVEEDTSRIPGVHAGDWAKYDVVFNSTTNDSNPPISLPPPGYNDVDYYMIEVIQVVGTNITFETSVCFRNGTRISNTLWMDLSSSYAMIFPPPFIPSNLSAGDRLYNDPYSITINATLARIYTGVEREVNLLHMEKDLDYLSGYQVTNEIMMYWDRASGIVDELVQSIRFTKIPEGYETRVFAHMVMRETNIWRSAGIETRLFIFPRILNLESEGKWVTAWVLLPSGYDARDIDASTIMLNDTVPQARYMNLGARLLIVKFDRNQTASYILRNVRMKLRYVTVVLTVSGRFKDGTSFQGHGRIGVIMPSKDKMTDSHEPSPLSFDSQLFCSIAAAYGSSLGHPKWNPLCDLNEDGKVDLKDYYVACKN